MFWMLRCVCLVVTAQGNVEEDWEYEREDHCPYLWGVERKLYFDDLLDIALSGRRVHCRIWDILYGMGCALPYHFATCFVHHRFFL
jgi:hypothetical protein